MRFDSPANYGPAFDTRPISDAQFRYLNDLRIEYRRLFALLNAADVKIPAFASVPIPRNCSEAHRCITQGKKIVAQLRALARDLPTASPTAKTVVEEGMWIIGDLDNGGTIFKVQRSHYGNEKAIGRLYAKRLDSDGHFVTASGAMKDLAIRGRKMTKAEAKAYGALYGTCCRCGRTLTDEDSIANGYGPVCAQYFA